MSKIKEELDIIRENRKSRFIPLLVVIISSIFTIVMTIVDFKHMVLIGMILQLISACWFFFIVSDGNNKIRDLYSN